MNRLLSLLLFVVVCSAAGAQGALTFDSETHEFGSMLEGEKPSHTFRFTNTGDAPIRITQVQPSCGCTAPSFSTEPVAPNQEGHITVEYDSDGRPGAFNKTITVRTDASVVGHTTLRITGTVSPVNIQNGAAQGGVVFDADLHTFNFLQSDGPVRHAFRMQNEGDRPIRIVAARVMNRAGSSIVCAVAPCTPRSDDEQARSSAVAVTFPDRFIFPNEIVEIDVAIADVALTLDRRGVLDVAIVLATDDENQPAKSLRLRGRATSPEQATVTQ